MTLIIVIFIAIFKKIVFTTGVWSEMRVILKKRVYRLKND